MINSSTVFTGRLGFTTSTLGAKEIRDTGVKSLSRSKGNFLYKLGFTAKAAVTAKGGDASKIEFRQLAEVRGPNYESDYKNKAKYEPFQYVKVIAK